jgi:fibro-slime domain-containing protein
MYAIKNAIIACRLALRARFHRGRHHHPVDGNEGQPHNYHFTCEIHSRFTCQGFETFHFAGDDDLWVFINDSLVIDLGGVHAALSDSVELTTLGADKRHTTASNFLIETSIVLKKAPEPGSRLLLGLGTLALVRRRS